MISWPRLFLMAALGWSATVAHASDVPGRLQPEAARRELDRFAPPIASGPAALTASGGWEQSFTCPGPDGIPYAGVFLHGQLVIGGDFREIDGNETGPVAIWNGTSW